MMVIPIVVMLAVTIVVAGWQYEEPIEWEEGYNEATMTVFPESNEIIPQNESLNVVAESTINGEEALELNVTPNKFVRKMHTEYEGNVLFSVDGDIPSELEPEELIIETEVKEAPEFDDIVQGWYQGFWEAEDLDLWPQEELNTGAGGEEPLRIGSDIESTNFSAEGESRFTYFERDVPFDEPITIEITAILRGLAEEVTARVEITFEREDA